MGEVQVADTAAFLDLSRREREGPAMRSIVGG